MGSEEPIRGALPKIRKLSSGDSGAGDLRARSVWLVGVVDAEKAGSLGLNGNGRFIGTTVP